MKNQDLNSLLYPLATLYTSKEEIPGFEDKILNIITLNDDLLYNTLCDLSDLVKYYPKEDIVKLFNKSHSVQMN